MITFQTRNVHEVLPHAYKLLLKEGKRRDSRNGPVYVFEDPVTTLYEKPTERVMFWPERDCNPFFHFMEGLWMIAGRNDVDFVSKYAKNMVNFSDDGVTFHGAYGYRWRQEFGGDQLTVIAETLKNNPDDRRVVLQMWHTGLDLGRTGKDLPCNLMILFRVSPYGKLDMTVFNRSNDVIWGAYGANAVHMSMLQEFMAGWIGIPVGRYWQISNNFHGYDDTMEKHKGLKNADLSNNPYAEGIVKPYPMINSDISVWQEDLRVFMDEGPIVGFRDHFFRRVVTPIYNSWEAWKNKDVDVAIEIMQQCKALDWQKACIEWLERRK